MYSNCKNVNMYYKKRWPMLLKWGLFSRLPGLIVFRAIKTGICSPGWRQNNSNKTKWPMSSRLNNVLCVRQHMDFGNEFENCFPKFGKVVGKVWKLKTKLNNWNLFPKVWKDNWRDLKIENKFMIGNYFPRFDKMVGKVWTWNSKLKIKNCFPRFDKMVGKVWKLKTKWKLKTVFQGLTRWLARSQTPRPLQTPCGRVTT